MSLNNCYVTAVALCLLTGCGPATLGTAEKGRQAALDARQIFDLVSANTLRLTAYDFDGQIFFGADGSMSGLDSQKQQDTGSWDISSENRLCMKFRIWYHGDIKCYAIVPGDGENLFNFFTSNGAAYYAATVVEGDPQKLARQVKPKESKRYLRESLAAAEPSDKRSVPAAAAAPSAIKSTGVPADDTAAAGGSVSIARLARNCPGCSLSGADLKEKNLIKANLEGADLSGADLRYTNLRRARLKGANLEGAKLNHANLPGADLRECNLKNADLRGANLLLADLSGADLDGADLTDAYLENTRGLKNDE
jgi:hypothetical protein